MVLIGTYCVIAQTGIQMDFSKYEEAQQSYISLTDPGFPSADKYDQNSAAWKVDMEQYAKDHPPAPEIINTGNVEADQADLDAKQQEWVSLYPEFPRFIPYHLFHKNLTMSDSQRYYENAISVWKKFNAGK